MNAVTHHRYGPIDQLGHAEVPVPRVGPNDVLVEVHHAAVNPADLYIVGGVPYLVRLATGLRRPKQMIRGTDMAGIVESVGRSVTRFAPGDRVVASAPGAFAECASVPHERVAHVPDDVELADAAALPIAAVTALQGLRDHGRVQPGATVLINGASGGVGSFAIQIAKAMGAEVTAVCSTSNIELVRSLGADHVVDYTTHDVVLSDARFDVLLDNVGNWAPAACRRLVAHRGVYVMVSGPMTSRVVGPIRQMIAAKLRFAFRSQHAAVFVANETADDVIKLMDMIQHGEMRVVIDRRFPLSKTVDALRHLATGRARGKVLIDVKPGLATS